MGVLKALPTPIVNLARQLRRKQTDAEQFVWDLLRNRRLGGYKFRRQYAVGRFILDFYCAQARLALELDGGGHAEPSQSRYDNTRALALEAYNIRVLRFWNNDVFTHTEEVLAVIWEALQAK